MAGRAGVVAAAGTGFELVQLQITSNRRTANPRALVTMRPRFMLFRRAMPLCQSEKEREGN